MKARVVDIFCGIGGLSYGFKQAGFEIAAGVDSDPTCKYAYEKNTDGKFISDDIRAFSANRLKALFEKGVPKILIGCAPCTPFSPYVRRYKKSPSNDDRWGLLNEFLRLAVATRPDVISMENVCKLAQQKVFTSFVSTLESCGYSVTTAHVRAEQYGVPQTRTRLVLLASRHGVVSLPEPTHLKKSRTVRDAIGRFPAINAGESHPRDRLHSARGLTERNLRRLRATAEGGSWKDWDDDLKLDCHKRASGKTFRSVYGRMRWDRPSPVITTQCLGIGNGRFGHPDQDRAISIREAAALQSFPSSYVFAPPNEIFSGTALARHIGNAVPVKLALIIGQAIKRHLAETLAP